MPHKRRSKISYRRLASLAIFVLCLTTATGCGTYASLQHRQSDDPVVFGGLRTDVNTIRRGPAPDMWLRKHALYNPYLDLPFSTVLDGLMLPYTVAYSKPARKARPPDRVCAPEKQLDRISY